MKINIIKIISDTVVDGPRMRTSIYVSGCKNKCPGCHNPDAQIFGSGTDYEISDVVSKVKEYGHSRVTLSGGDPFWNIEVCSELCRELRKEIPGINIWAYTGFTMEQILEGSGKGLLDLLDGLVDGPYVESKKSEEILWRGSWNQRIWTRDSDGSWTTDNKYDAEGRPKTDV